MVEITKRRTNEHETFLLYFFKTRFRSLRSWRDFVRECFCFGSEAVNASGEAVRGLVKTRVEALCTNDVTNFRPPLRLRQTKSNSVREVKEMYANGE